MWRPDSIAHLSQSTRLARNRPSLGLIPLGTCVKGRLAVAEQRHTTELAERGMTRFDPEREGAWEGPTALADPDWYGQAEAGSTGGAPVQGPHNPRDFAQRLFAYEALNAPLSRKDGDAEPYSLEWFLNIENQRHSKHGRWIPKLLEFAKHAGET